MPSLRRLCQLSFTPLAAAVALCAWPSSVLPASADATADPSTCTYVAAPGGSDSASGTASDPFRTASHLASALGPGQTGCLRAGVYSEDVYIYHGGTSSAPMTLRSYPGETATVSGRVYLARGADWTTVSDLNLVGIDHSNDCAPLLCPSPTINAEHTSWLRDDVTDNHTAICFHLGGDGYGDANYTTIRDSRIHDCGKLPATNHQHGFYLNQTDYSQIVDNLIYDNADKGIVFFPSGNHTLVKGNVIWGNGEGIDFGASAPDTSSYNTVENNIIADSRVSYNVMSYYGDGTAADDGGPQGVDNVVRDNCIGGGPRDDDWSPDGVDTSGGGFTLQNNVHGRPQFMNPSAGNFTLKSGSPCQGVLTATTAGPNGSTTPRVHHRHQHARVWLSLRKAIASAQSGPERLASVYGGVRPASKSAHKWVVIEQRRGRRWRELAATPINAHGRFSIIVRLPGPAAKLRAYIRGIGHSRALLARA